MRRRWRLLGFACCILCAVWGAQAAAVIRLSATVATRVLGEQFGIEVSVVNQGSAPALDVAPYLVLGGRSWPLAPLRRLDPGESHRWVAAFPLGLAVRDGGYAPLYLPYSDSVAKRSTALALVDIPGQTGPDESGLHLRASPLRSGSGFELELENRGSVHLSIRLKALATPACRVPRGLPAGTLALAPGERVSVPLSLDRSPCSDAGVFPLVFLAVPIGDGDLKAAAAFQEIVAEGDQSLLQRIYGHIDRVLWGIWALLVVFVLSVAIGGWRSGALRWRARSPM